MSLRRSTIPQNTELGFEKPEVPYYEGEGRANLQILKEKPRRIDYDIFINKYSDIIEGRFPLSLVNKRINESIYRSFYNSSTILNSYNVMDWSPSGILTTAINNIIYIYLNGSTGTLLSPNEEDISALSFLHDKNIATGDINDNIVVVGTKRGNIGLYNTLSGNKKIISQQFALSPINAISPFSNEIFFYAQSNNISFFDSRSNNIQQLDPLFRNNIEHLKWSLDRKYLVSSSKGDRKMAFWDIRAMKEPYTLVNGYGNFMCWIDVDGKQKLLSAMESKLFAFDVSMPEIELDFMIDFEVDINYALWVKQANRLILAPKIRGLPLAITTYPRNVKKNGNNIGTSNILSSLISSTIRKPTTTQTGSNIQSFRNFKLKLEEEKEKEERGSSIQSTIRDIIIGSEIEDLNSNIIELDGIIETEQIPYVLKSDPNEEKVAVYERNGNVGIEIFDVFKKDITQSKRQGEDISVSSKRRQVM